MTTHEAFVMMAVVSIVMAFGNVLFCIFFRLCYPEVIKAFISIGTIAAVLALITWLI
jgi:hypothetical protein